MGLISGAMEGAGRAGVVALHTAQQQYGAEELLKMKTEADKELQTSMQSFHRGENEQSRGLQRDLATQTDTRIKEEGGATRGLQEKLAGQTDARIKAEGEAGRALTREQITSHEKLAGATNARISAEAKLNRDQQLTLHTERMAEMKEQFKNQGLSIQNTTSGVVIVDQKNKTSTPVLGADGKQLKSLNQDDSFKVLGALGNLAKAAADAGDTATSKMYLDMAGSVLKGRGEGGGAERSAIPAVGAVVDGFKFKGGNPKDRKNWAPAQTQGARSSGLIEGGQGYGATLDEMNPRKPREPLTDEQRRAFATPEG